jgi:hypothetical protein
VDCVLHHSKDVQLGFLIDPDWPKLRIRRFEPHALCGASQPLYSMFPIDRRYDHRAGHRLCGTIHHNQIPVEDARAAHTVTFDTHEEGRGFVPNQESTSRR